jgi:outer membrane protein OmpA-like peptidoglycan-associated protein
MAINRRQLLAGFAVLATPAFAQNVVYLSQAEALELEHSTRMSRLKRWADTFGVQSPDFSSYTIPAEALRPAYDIDVPVLRIVFPESAFFDLGSDIVKESAIPLIRAMAQTLNGDVPDVTVFVAGHTDSRGGDAYNHNLSVRRSQNVAQMLKDFQGSEKSVWSIGFGKSVPLYPNTTEANMSYNRRVEFLLSARPDAIALWLSDQAVVACPKGNAADKFRCMRDFQREPSFQAVEIRERRPAGIALGRPKQKTVRLGKPIQQAITPTESKSIVIRLNEKPVFVKLRPH